MAYLRVDGKPIGKGRPKFSRQGNFVKTYTPDRTVSYENLVRLAWWNSGQEKMEGNLQAIIKAHFKIPSSVSKKKHAELLGKPYPHKPDADNIAKIVLDSLNGGNAYDDDACVTRLEVEKVYDESDFMELFLMPDEGGKE